MRSNLRRASRSITRNIAEGFGRFHYKENIQFCRISRGSLFEIKEDLNICLDEGNIHRDRIHQGQELIGNAIKSINGYISYLNRVQLNK